MHANMHKSKIRNSTFSGFLAQALCLGRMYMVLRVADPAVECCWGSSVPLHASAWVWRCARMTPCAVVAHICVAVPPVCANAGALALRAHTTVHEKGWGREKEKKVLKSAECFSARLAVFGPSKTPKFS
jgi:hypothetical protein